MRVVISLGHCGASKNEYELFDGTKQECFEFAEKLPMADVNDFCQHCGGFDSTYACQEVAEVV